MTADSTEEKCGLCGLVALGWALADRKRLCHAPERDCYFRWTVEGERPGGARRPEPVGSEKR